jgi:hypothetical protein
MHRSRINGLLIDCKTDDIDAAASFWAETLGRPVDPNHPGTRGNYRMLETLPARSAYKFSAWTMKVACTSISRPTTFLLKFRALRSWAQRSTNAWNGG